jgi:hypothetical protein
MFTLLTLKDILICVVSLETLLQISELGKTSCELIASFNSAIDCGLNKNYILLNKYYIILYILQISVLVGILTTDAASFGQAGLYGIKVIEVRGHHMQPYVNVGLKLRFL